MSGAAAPGPFRPIGLVLAGGLGRRMGRPKGEIEVDGVRLARRAAAELAPLCREVLISVRPGAPNPAPEWDGVEDALPAGRGPLAGILAAFERTRPAEADLLVLACDYPRVGADLLRELLRAARPADDVVLAVDAAGREHPLVALWRRAMEPRIEAALSRGEYAVRDVLRTAALGRVVPVAGGPTEPEPLVNLNRAADL